MSIRNWIVGSGAAVILLAGGDKSTQSADIKNALRLARNLSGEYDAKNEIDAV